jgi:hypothetical protein
MPDPFRVCHGTPPEFHHDHEKSSAGTETPGAKTLLELIRKRRDMQGRDPPGQKRFIQGGPLSFRAAYAVMPQNKIFASQKLEDFL